MINNHIGKRDEYGKIQIHIICAVLTDHSAPGLITRCTNMKMEQNRETLEIPIYLDMNI